MIAAYEEFGPTAKTVDQLERNVKKEVEKECDCKLGVAGTTNSSGKVDVKPDPNPYRVKATEVHEAVHEKAVKNAIAKYGENTPAFNKWYLNPHRWAANEVRAYSADIKYMEQVIPTIK